MEVPRSAKPQRNIRWDWNGIERQPGEIILNQTGSNLFPGPFTSQEKDSRDGAVDLASTTPTAEKTWQEIQVAYSLPNGDSYHKKLKAKSFCPHLGTAVIFKYRRI